MFTGIVQAIGNIVSVTALAGNQDGVRLVVDAASLGMQDVAIGDSIAIQGACMTVVAMTTNSFEVDVSRESLDKTVGLAHLGRVNLEKAVTLATKLGGHLVTGHVDGLGVVRQFHALGESWLLEVVVPVSLGKFFAYKGSATINGVSLTVNSVSDSAEGTAIAINLIPHTIQVTTLGALKPEVKVNVEVDLIARYVERMLSTSQLNPSNLGVSS
jgi:riboflavin synthase